MTEHTALPWTYQDDLEINGCYIILHKGGGVTEIVPYWDNYDNYTMDEAEAKANARFIVTACNCHAELLKALRGTLDALVEWRVFRENEWVSGDTKAMSEAREAIRNAEEQAK